ATQPVGFEFRDPLPLQPTIAPAAGHAPALAGLSSADQTPGGDPIYHDTSEPFTGGGIATYIDGHPADGAKVDLYLRLVTTTTAGEQSNLPDTTLLGWCKVGSVVADAHGA